MIEFPETESRRELDGFAAAFERAVHDTPEHLHARPDLDSRSAGSTRSWRPASSSSRGRTSASGPGNLEALPTVGSPP